ncbi:alpha-glucosidase, partial [Capronia coronata CBS 617.96]
SWICPNERQSQVLVTTTFHFIGLDHPLYDVTSWKLSESKYLVERWQLFIEGTDGWTTAFCENHDSGRAVSRFGSDSTAHWKTSADIIAQGQSTLTGSLFLYQGQEFGMCNIPGLWPIEESKE